MVNFAWFVWIWIAREWANKYPHSFHTRVFPSEKHPLIWIITWFTLPLKSRANTVEPSLRIAGRGLKITRRSLISWGNPWQSQNTTSCFYTWSRPSSTVRLSFQQEVSMSLHAVLFCFSFVHFSFVHFSFVHFSFDHRRLCCTYFCWCKFIVFLARLSCCWCVSYRLLLSLFRSLRYLTACLTAGLPCLRWCVHAYVCSLRSFLCRFTIWVLSWYVGWLVTTFIYLISMVE